MNYQEIATIILIFIALQASEGFVQGAGERLFERIEAAIQNVRQKLKGDTFAELTLESAIEKPESEGRRAALQEVLIEKMEGDNSFVENLRQLIHDVKQADTNQVLALGKRSVAVGGDVKESTIITGDSNVVGGGISQSVTATDGSTISGVNQIAKEAKEIDKKE
jgi:hypothetical protein